MTPTLAPPPRVRRWRLLLVAASLLWASAAAARRSRRQISMPSIWPQWPVLCARRAASLVTGTRRAT
mgnify:CR=1 FL=1